MDTEGCREQVHSGSISAVDSRGSLLTSGRMSSSGRRDSSCTPVV